MNTPSTTPKPNLCGVVGSVFGLPDYVLACCKDGKLVHVSGPSFPTLGDAVRVANGLNTAKSDPRHVSEVVRWAEESGKKRLAEIRAHPELMHVEGDD
jgi:hypothetical protein